MIGRSRVPPLAAVQRGLRRPHSPRVYAMSQRKAVRLQEHFADLTDPRRREVKYPLINFVVIAVCAVICGADDFVAIARFGETRQDWLGQFLNLASGIPSHDRFNAVLAALKPEEFEKCLLSL